jgi:MFS family permease
VGWLFLAIATGLVEAAVNPLAAALYPGNKTHVMNVLHAWWPGGLILGGLLAYGLSAVLQAADASQRLLDISWQIKMSLVFVPVALYAFLIFGQRFPQTERAQAGVKAGAMFREALRPMFLLLVFCMFLTASIELGPARWVGVFIQDIIGIRGVLFLVYTSGLMFVLRFFAGPLAHRFSTFGLMALSSVLACAGLVALSYSRSWLTVFLAATVFGVGVTYFWPTMLGITSERFPKGGAFLLGIIGAAGGLFLAYVTIPGMGRIHDHYTLQGLPEEVKAKVVVDGRVDEGKVKALAEEGTASVQRARRDAASITFRYVAVMAAILVLVFGALFFCDRAAGARSQTAAGAKAPPGEA